MLSTRRSRKRPLSNEVNKFIMDFPDLIYDTFKVKCLVCNTYLMCWSKTHCKDHVSSSKHNNNKINRQQFIHEVCLTMIVCTLPFTLLSNDLFISFWNKYANYTLPSTTTLRRNLPSVRKQFENKIKAELKNKKLWLCVGETTDSKKNSVVNVMVRTMEPHQPTSSILLASRRLEECNAEKISEMLLNTLEKFELSKDQVLMLMTDGAATMCSVGQSLKKQCGNFLHITCKLHVLCLVAEQVSRCYPEVDALITSTKALFLKSPKHIRKFNELCPHIPVPPQLIQKHSDIWLRAGFYYHEHFEKIKEVVLSFDSKESAAISTSQKKFQDAQIKMDLQSIHQNYLKLEEAITKLENSSLLLEDSLQIIKDVHAQLCTVEDATSESVLIKFKSVLDKNPDFDTLTRICEGTSTDALSCLKEYFNYANITSLDVERSFSEYKNIFSSRRTCFSETTLETHLMLKIYNQISPVCQS